MSFVTGTNFSGAEIKLRTTELSGAENAHNVIPIENDGTAVGLSAKLGAVTETAPSTDTGSSGLNGRLQRLAQHLSTLITALATQVSTFHRVSTATTNAVNVKASAGVLRAARGFNTHNVPIYLKFHNNAGTPTAGAGVVYTVGVQAGLPFDHVISGAGRAFSTGIALTIVKDLADAGVTIAEADKLIVELEYV